MRTQLPRSWISEPVSRVIRCPQTNKVQMPAAAKIANVRSWEKVKIKAN